MQRTPKALLKILDNIIVSHLQTQPGRTKSEIAEHVLNTASKSGIINLTELDSRRKENITRTIGNHVDGLVESKAIKAQQGFFIDQDWKEGLPKAYVFIVTRYPDNKVRGTHYQKILLDQIRDGFKKHEHDGLNLFSAEIVLGHEYDLIVCVYGTKIDFIGTFVMDYLLTNELVAKTHTVMVWPSEEKPSEDSNEDEPDEEDEGVS